jgi:cysteine desulfurase
MRRIYLDHSATTPLDGRVLDAMLPFLTDKFGNASSVHSFGQETRAALDKARRQVASLINARTNEIVFTSGGTEANNLAIRGICEANRAHGQHIITSAIEHPSVRGAIDHLEKQGWEVTRVPVSNDGIVQAQDVRAAIRPHTILISVMLANNEIGTIQPINEIGAFVREEKKSAPRIWLHTDAVQAAGRLPIDVGALDCDLLSMSAHKIYGPKGTGALYVRRGTRLFPQQVGGHQERERRAGTESVANIAGFGVAAELAQAEMRDRSEHTRRLRDRFEDELKTRIEDIVFNGGRERRLPHLANVSFRFIEGEGLLIHLDMQGVAVSTGSACSSGTLEPSPVIRALGGGEELARGAIRFSFGKDNTEDDVDYTIEALSRAVGSLRALSPLARAVRTPPACSA